MSLFSKCYKLKAYLPFAFILFFIPIFSYAQFFDEGPMRQLAEKAIHQVYNYEFNKAAKGAAQLKRAYPTHPIGYFVAGLNRWWQNYASENTDLYLSYIHTQIDSAMLLNKKYAKNPEFEREYVFIQYMCYGLKAKAYSATDEWWSAANAARRIIGYLKRSFSLKEKQIEFYFNSGIYQYYAEVYPKQRPIVKPFMIFFPDGDEEKGLEELEKVGASPNYAQAETLFYLHYIYMDERRNPGKALRVSEKLVEQFPLNTWFRADYAHALAANKRFDEAEKIFVELRNSYESQPNAFTQNITSKYSRYTSHIMIKVYLYQGKSRFLQHKYKEAIELLDKSFVMAKLANVKERDYLSSATYYKARCYDAMGQREKAVEWYEKVLDRDENFTVRADAKECLKAPCGEP